LTGDSTSLSIYEHLIYNREPETQGGHYCMQNIGECEVYLNDGSFMGYAEYHLWIASLRKVKCSWKGWIEFTSVFSIQPGRYKIVFENKQERVIEIATPSSDSIAIFSGIGPAPDLSKPSA
tara:strand:- start:179 stop:541 length:363 start_codon:yes stop_codon:yes gene_type:complete